MTVTEIYKAHQGDSGGGLARDVQLTHTIKPEVVAGLYVDIATRRELALVAFGDKTPPELVAELIKEAEERGGPLLGKAVFQLIEEYF